MSTNFSKNIKILRKELDLKQEDIAKLLNVARNTYSHYEAGRNEPSYEVLIKLSKIFNCSIDYLLNNDIENLDNNHFSLESTIKYLKSRKGVCINAIEKLNGEIKDIDKIISFLSDMSKKK